MHLSEDVDDIEIVQVAVLIGVSKHEIDLSLKQPLAYNI